MVTCKSSELGWEVTVELPADFLSLGRGSVKSCLLFLLFHLCIPSISNHVFFFFFFIFVFHSCQIIHLSNLTKNHNSLIRHLYLLYLGLHWILSFMTLLLCAYLFLGSQLLVVLTKLTGFLGKPHP